MLQASLSVIGAFLALVAPSAAVASTAEVKSSETCPSEFECNGFPTSAAVAQYDAAAGELNALELSFADAVMLRDPGAAVSAGNSCTSVSAHDVTCRPDEAGGAPRVAAQLGDLNDTLTVVGAFPFATSADGGPGNDTLSGGPESDTFDGGAGEDRVAGGEAADQLTGGEGGDSVLGGAGDDTLIAAEDGAPDVYDGGDGRDEVSFFGSRRGATVTLGGAAGEGGDTFMAVEDATGGLGDDRLTGDGGANELSGDSGADHLDGGPGADTLDGGPGRDVIRGGSGNDEFVKVAVGAGARAGDRVFCGAGVDTILTANAGDVLARDCERIDLGVATIRPHPVAVRGGRARFTIPCRSRRGCRGSVRLRRAGARHGGNRRAFRTGRTGRITVAVPLPRRGALVRVSVSVVRRGDAQRGRAAYTVRIPRR